jgi:hypothetical protein
MKSEQPATAGAATGSPITLSTNCVIEGKFFAAGAPIPFANAAAVPASLKPFIAAAEPDEPPGRPGIRFEPGRVYNIDDRGAIITRAGAREAARLAGEAAWQQQAEEEALRQGELPPETRQVLEDIHACNIGLQIKAAEVAQARRDDQEAALARAAEEPKKPSPLCVRRGAVFMTAAKARLRPGETIYQRQPSGELWAVGLVDANGRCPPPEVTL